MSECRVTLKPFMKDGYVSHVDVRLEFDTLQRNAGSELCRVQVMTVSIPCCDPQNFCACDRQGKLAVAEENLNSYPYEYKIYKTERNTEGPVTISYSLFPRPWKPEDTCGPYFDLKSEEGGANASGLALLPIVDKYEGLITLHWDLSEMPKGSYGVNTFAEGDFTKQMRLEQLQQSYFAVGQLNSITEGDFGFYWLGQPPFDVAAIAEYTQKLFAVMAPFFRDTQSLYKIFLRRDYYPTSGGTALPRSYMFGWTEHQPVSVESRQNILAHEMVHNWPALNDNPYGITTWYSEGTAEYYSIMLPLRAGLITKETALNEIQQRTDAYYKNPTRHLDNMAAARVCWQDRRAQKLAYGRGIFFLANVDAQMRKATDGKACLDDVVLKILEIDRAGGPLSNELFLNLVREMAGIDVAEQHKLMCDGVDFAPLPDSFDGHFTNIPVQTKEADTGNDTISYQWSLK